MKDVCNVLMQQYAVRTTGAFVEDDKVASITWHYGSTDPEFGAMQVCVYIYIYTYMYVCMYYIYIYI